MAGQTNDDGSVLGNLPRERPGRRSAKRSTSGGTPKRQPAESATARRSATSPRKAATSTGGAKRAPGGGPAAGRARQPDARQAPRTPAAGARPAHSSGPDPVGDALRLAGKFAELGLKTAGGIIRRLPGR